MGSSGFIKGYPFVKIASFIFAAGKLPENKNNSVFVI